MDGPLSDVNVLAYAHREGAANHLAYRQWLGLVILWLFSVGLEFFLGIAIPPKIFEARLYFIRRALVLPNK